MKKVLIAGTVILLMLMAACGGGSGSGGKTDNQTGQTETNGQGGAQQPNEQAPKKDPVTLTAMVQNHGAFPFNENWMIWDVYEQKANVKLDVSAYQGNWWETIPLIVTSGDMPDLMWMSGSGNFNKYGGDGALVDLMAHLDKMPNLKKFMEQHPEETASVTAADGKMYLPPTKGGYPAGSSVLLYREDILKKHQITPPETLDEFYDVLKQLKQLYPDSFPYVINQLGGILYNLTANFGTGESFYWNFAENKAKYGPIEDSFRDMVAFINKLYMEKLIPTDFLTLDSKQLDDFLTNDKSFFYNGYVSNIAKYNGAVRPTNPEYSLVHAPALEGPAGKFYAKRTFITEGWTVTVQNPSKLDDILAFIDWLYTEEGREAVSWGLEGETYEMAADGTKKFLDSVKNLNSLTAEFGIKSSGNFQWFNEEAWMSLMTDEDKSAQEAAIEFLAPNKASPAFTSAEESEIKIKSDTISTHMLENISKFLIGQRSLDEWDDYVNEMKQLGVDDVTAVWQTAFERQMQ